MSRKPKSKKQGVKSLLELLGADPNEEPPASIREARMLQEERGVITHDEEELPRCSVNGKVCFSSETQAKKAMRARLNKACNTSKLRCYHCPDCKEWHITSLRR